MAITRFIFRMTTRQDKLLSIILAILLYKCNCQCGCRIMIGDRVRPLSKPNY